MYIGQLTDIQTLTHTHRTFHVLLKIKPFKEPFSYTHKHCLSLRLKGSYFAWLIFFLSSGPRLGGVLKHLDKRENIHPLFDTKPFTKECGEHKLM